MGRTRFYLNKFLGQPSVFDVLVLDELLRLEIASTQEIRQARNLSKEHEWVDLMRDTLTNGDTIFDIGSNIGLVSLLLAKHDNGVDSTVHCFEPEPTHFHQLSKNVEHNTLVGRLHPHQLALGSKDGPIDLPILESPRKARRFDKTDDGTDSITVQMQTMDSFVEQHRVAPDIVKINVKGAEGQVLAGMEALFVSGAPRELFLDVHTKGNGKFMPDGETRIENWLADRGYTLVWNHKHRSTEHCHFKLTL